MANTIKLKRGSGSDPSASDLSVGEVAVRTDEGKLFTKKDDGTVAEISGGGSGTTINNNADNRVITGSGTANTLNGESTFTYDGAGVLTLLSTDTSSSALPIIELYRNSASPADADYLGQLKFTGESDDGSKEVYAKMTAKIDDASSTTEDGLFEFALRKAGSNNICGRFTSTALKLINGTGLEVAANASVGGNLSVVGTIASELGISDLTSVTAPKVLGSNGIMEMKAEIGTNHTLSTGYNAISVDPTIANGITVTVPSGAVWSIV